MPFIRDGKLLALAVSSSKRASALPDVPTTVEAGYPNSDFDFWIGMFVPKQTPRGIVARIHQETVKGLEDAGVKDKLAKLGVEPMIMTPEAFDARIAKEAPHRARTRQGGRHRGEVVSLVHGRLHPHRDQDQRRAHRHRARRQGTAAAADARQSVHASVLAQIRAAAGAGVHRGRHRPARLRRFGEAAGRRRPQRLFVPRHGAGPGRGDGVARLRALLRRRPRPRRARAPPHVPRPSGQGRARGDPRHHSAASPVHANRRANGRRRRITGSS